MQHTDQDAQAAPFNTTTAEDSDRTERVRLYAADAPPVAWEDEWVDIGGEG